MISWNFVLSWDEHEKNYNLGAFSIFFSNSLAFASEPVIASLSNLLGNYERMPVPPPTEVKVHITLHAILWILILYALLF